MRQLPNLNSNPVPNPGPNPNPNPNPNQVSRAFVQQLPLEQVRKVLVMRALLAAISVREIRHMVYVLAGLDLSSDLVLGTPSDPRHCADSRFPSTMRTPGAQMLTSAQYFFRA